MNKERTNTNRDNKVNEEVENGRGQADGATAKGGEDTLKIVNIMRVVDGCGNIVSEVRTERKFIDFDEMDLSSIEGASRTVSRMADPLIRASREASKGTMENMTSKASKKNSRK